MRSFHRFRSLHSPQHHLTVVVTALIEGLCWTPGKPFLLAGGSLNKHPGASGWNPSIPGCCRALIIPSDLCRLRPLQNTQINQERQTGYRVISYPCCSDKRCQTYMVTDAHKQILIIPPEGSNYSPSGFQQKPNRGGHDLCWCESPLAWTDYSHFLTASDWLPVHSLHMSQQLSFTTSGWLTLGSGLWFGSTFTHSDCCISPYKQCPSLDNDKTMAKTDDSVLSKGIVIHPVQRGG